MTLLDKHIADDIVLRRQHDLLLNDDFTHSIVFSYKPDLQFLDEEQKFNHIRDKMSYAISSVNKTSPKQKMHQRNLPFYYQHEFSNQNNDHVHMLLDLSVHDIRNKIDFLTFLRSGYESPNLSNPTIGRLHVEMLPKHTSSEYQKAIRYHSKGYKDSNSSKVFYSDVYKASNSLLCKLKKAAEKKGDQLQEFTSN